MRHKSALFLASMMAMFASNPVGLVQPPPVRTLPPKGRKSQRNLTALQAEQDAWNHQVEANRLKRKAERLKGRK